MKVVVFRNRDVLVIIIASMGVCMLFVLISALNGSYTFADVSPYKRRDADLLELKSSCIISRSFAIPLICYVLVLTVIALALSWFTRNVPVGFNGSHQLFLVSGIMLVFIVIFCPLILLIDDPDGVALVQGLSLSLLCSIMLLTVFVPKAIIISQGNENNQELLMTSVTSTSRGNKVEDDKALSGDNMKMQISALKKQNEKLASRLKDIETRIN